MLMAKKKKSKKKNKKTGERKDYWNRSKVFFGLPHTCVRKTAKEERVGEVAAAEAQKEFYKTAIVVGGVSCRPVLDATNDV